MRAGKTIKHTLSVDVVNTGDCGEHGCTGHREQFAVCSCGWRLSLFGINLPGIQYERVIAEFEHIKHRLETLENGQ